MFYLDLIQNIKDRFSAITFVDIIPFLIGLFFGFLFCLLIYAIIIIASFKHDEKKAKKVVIKVEDEVIMNYITNAKNMYKEEVVSLKTKDRLVVLKEKCFDLINDIASVYYPESNHPTFELSIDELIQLSYYIVERIEKLFTKRVLKKIRQLRIVTISNALDKKKEIENNKLVKAAKKANVTGVAKVLMAAKNIINPVYWVRKVMIDAPFLALMNKIALTIIDVVGEETSKVYSKGVFVKEDDEVIVKEINEMIGDNINE